MKTLPQALFISHGGGPLPLLGDPGHRELVSCLQGLASAYPKPDAMVVVSAHWEAAVPTITSGTRPPLIYDYYGFPEASYRIEYPCPGEPVLAADIRQRLNAAGLDAALDPSRGFDHGVFVPLKILYPAANIPCVQVSLVDGLDPEQHMDLGHALGELAGQNVLLIGSGFSFHNMRAFFSPNSAESSRLNQAFEAWLHATCAETGCTEAERRTRLARWSDAPGARFCHPREEHLLPLHVCYGAAGAACSEHFALDILGKASSLYAW